MYERLICGRLAWGASIDECQKQVLTADMHTDVDIDLILTLLQHREIVMRAQAELEKAAGL
jgi:hypothetical protein